MAGSEHIEVHLGTGSEAVESRFSGADSVMVDRYATVEQIRALEAASRAQTEAGRHMVAAIDDLMSAIRKLDERTKEAESQVDDHRAALGFLLVLCLVLAVWSLVVTIVLVR